MTFRVFEVDKTYAGEASHIGLNSKYVVSFMPVTEEVTQVVTIAHNIGVRIKYPFMKFYDWCCT